MATLTIEEKVAIRNAIARKATESDIPVRWVKACINDAAQAVETLIANSSVAISNAIDTATVVPYGVTFTAAEKRWIVALTVLVKHNRDMV